MTNLNWMKTLNDKKEERVDNLTSRMNNYDDTACYQHSIYKNEVGARVLCSVGTKKDKTHKTYLIRLPKQLEDRLKRNVVGPKSCAITSLVDYALDELIKNNQVLATKEFDK